MAPMGTIKSEIQLDKSRFYGSEDTITGRVALTFLPTQQPKATDSKNGSTEQQLFGPLQLSVTLHGHVKYKVLENRTSHAYILFWDIRKLFSKNTLVFDGPFRAQAGVPQVFNFATSFPKLTDSNRGFRDLMPPTFYTRFQVRAPRQAGKHQGAAWIEYALQAQVDMPGIDVRALRSAEETVQYEQSIRYFPDDHDSREFEQKHIVSSYELLPEDQRPNGLIDRTRAVFKNVAKPTYTFEAICTSIPKVIHLGDSVKFGVRVRTDTLSNRGAVTPGILLGACEVELVAKTQLQATNEKGVDSPKLDHAGIVATVTVSQAEPKGLFSKENDFTKSLSTDALPSNIISNFRIIKLERSYTMRIVLRFLVAGQTVIMKKELPVTFHSHPVSSPSFSSSFQGLAGPSRRRLELPDDDEPLPGYEDATKQAAVS